VAALFAKLDDVVLDRPDARVEFRSTIIADRGPRSAESIWGADFGLTAMLVENDTRTEKGVLGQAKHRPLAALPPKEAEQFRAQVAKMAEATWATIGLEVPAIPGVVPSVRIVGTTTTFGDAWAAQSVFSPSEGYETSIRPSRAGTGPAVLIWPALPLDDYLCDYVVGCPHGDRAHNFVQALSHSELPQLHVHVEKKV